MAKILVIDDEAAVRHVIGEMLTAAGHTVVQAANGKHGLDVFQQHAPDLIITDLIMPEKEGTQAIVELRRIDPSLPILAISGSSAHHGKLLDVALKFGANAILSKPFHAADLLKAVDSLIPSRGSAHPPDL